MSIFFLPLWAVSALSNLSGSSCFCYRRMKHWNNFSLSFADCFLLLCHLHSTYVHPDPKLGILERSRRKNWWGLQDKTAGKKIVRIGKSLKSQDDKPMQKLWSNQGFPRQKPLRKPRWNTWFFMVFFICLFSAVSSFLEPVRARKMDPATHYSPKDYALVLFCKNFSVSEEL